MRRDLYYFAVPLQENEFWFSGKRGSLKKRESSEKSQSSTILLESDGGGSEIQSTGDKLP
jgi:hypothetical protein